MLAVWSWMRRLLRLIDPAEILRNDDECRRRRRRVQIVPRIEEVQLIAEVSIDRIRRSDGSARSERMPLLNSCSRLKNVVICRHRMRPHGPVYICRGSLHRKFEDDRIVNIRETSQSVVAFLLLSAVFFLSFRCVLSCSLQKERNATIADLLGSTGQRVRLDFRRGEQRSMHLGFIYLFVER